MVFGLELTAEVLRVFPQSREFIDLLLHRSLVALGRRQRQGGNGLAQVGDLVNQHAAEADRVHEVVDEHAPSHLRE